MRISPAVFVLFLLATTLRAQEKPDVSGTSPAGDDVAKSKMVERLNGIVLPDIRLTEATLQDISPYLAGKAMEAERERMQHNTALEPLRIVVRTDTKAKVVLSLKNVPLSEVLRYIADETGSQLSVDAEGAVLSRSEGDAQPNASLLPAKVQEERRKLLEARLDEIIVPQIAFTGAHALDVVESFRRSLIEYDRQHDAGRKGINIVSLGESNSKAWDKQISIKDTNISLRKAFEQMAKLAGMKITIDPYAVVVEPDPRAEK